MTVETPILRFFRSRIVPSKNDAFRGRKMRLTGSSFLLCWDGARTWLACSCVPSCARTPGRSRPPAAIPASVLVAAISIRSLVWQKSCGDPTRGQSGGRTKKSMLPSSRSTLPRDKQRQCVQRVRDRSYRKVVEGTGEAVGRTIRRCAPCATATLTAVLLDTAPSAR